MSDYFRIVRGLELDETIRILQGAGVPGLTSDTNDAKVGSFYLNNTNGLPYSKILPGTGTNKWQVAGGGGTTFQLVVENPVLPSAPSALGANSVVIGSGSQTLATAPDSLALGNQAVARYPGAVVSANGRFASPGDAQAGKYLLRTVTTTNTPTEAFFDGTGGSVRLVLPDDSTWSFKATITAHRTDADDGHAGYTVQGVIYRKSGAGTVAFQGNPSKSVISESNTQWDINIIPDTTNGSLRVNVTGQTGKTIRWVALIETLEVTN